MLSVKLLIRDYIGRSIVEASSSYVICIMPSIATANLNFTFVGLVETVHVHCI